jgi:hypothetical protein
MSSWTPYGDGRGRIKPQVGTLPRIRVSRARCFGAYARGYTLVDDDRIRLSFEQAEGVEPLPSQLQLREVSGEPRAVLWNTIQGVLDRSTTPGKYLDTPWSTILKDEHVYRRHKMVDDFANRANDRIREIRSIFEHGDYVAVFGWLEFVLKHPACPQDLHKRIESNLRYSRAAYRVVDEQVICPIGSSAEHATIVKAFADLDASQFNGARSHLRSAASSLTAGEFADSVRESIHAVESVCRTLDPSADLSKALARLERKISIHPAMKKGFTSLYGYASDEGGIRHALLESVQAKVDEADALFMIGACAAFVSYLLNKARTNGFL